MHEGDRQTPEGFYAITPNLMNPNSNYYLAINTGFPNAFDKANARDGTFLMIHGDCSSSGCFAMTDEQIAEIYGMARDSLLGGHPSFQVQSYPFRMTAANLARHRTNPHMAFWRMLKIGNDHFEATHLQPRVDVCNRRYVFDAQPPPNATTPLVFDPNGKCPPYVINGKIAKAATAKQRADDLEYLELLKEDVAVAPIHSGLDGGMNSVFHARFPWKIVPLAIVLPAGAGPELPDLPPVPWTDNEVRSQVDCLAFYSDGNRLQGRKLPRPIRLHWNAKGIRRQPHQRSCRNSPRTSRLDLRCQPEIQPSARLNHSHFHRFATDLAVGLLPWTESFHNYGRI